MKKFTPGSLVAIAALAMAVQLGSCKRDLAEKESPAPPCRIKKVIQKINGLEDRNGEFTYNAAGDPIMFTPAIYRTGSVKYEFRYDNQRRLTDFIGYYPASSGAGGSFEIWRKFIYDDKGRIIRDTAYHNGTYGPTLTTYGNFKTLTKYEYDNEDRVSRKTWQQYLNDKINPGIMGDYVYLYNDDGNLIAPGAVYDNKVNIYRLHKVWMFLNCNYSRNNIKLATNYNDHGLPLGFPRTAPHTPNLGLMYWVSLNDVDIQYECK